MTAPRNSPTNTAAGRATDSRLLHELAGSPDERVRAEVAANPAISAWTLARLRRDSSPLVEARLRERAANPALRERTIRKARKIAGRTLVFRDAAIADARFILELRTDSVKSRYLSATSPDLSRQEEWLGGYEKSGSQAYFIIEKPDGERIGTVRIYDPIEDSFCWGSWIVKDGSAPTCAIESTLMVYDYMLGTLGFARTHLNMRRDNRSVQRYHRRFGAVKIGEAGEDDLYMIGRDALMQAVARHRRFLPDPIQVEFRE